MISWPANLPYPSNWSSVVDAGVLRTPVAAATPDQRRGFNAPLIIRQVDWQLDLDQYRDFMAFMDINGAAWFSLPIPIHEPGNDRIRTLVARLAGDIAANKVAHNVYTITAPIEASEYIPGRDYPVAAPTGHWIIAGDPPTPSTDWIIAGAPPTPSTDTVTGGTPVTPSALV